MNSFYYEKRTCYAVVEQPGDVTRYTHLFVTDDHEVFDVYKDTFLSGAGLQKPRVISDMTIGKHLSDMSVIEASAWVKDNLPLDGENPFTLASAYRCAYRLHCNA